MNETISTVFLVLSLIFQNLTLVLDEGFTVVTTPSY